MLGTKTYCQPHTYAYIDSKHTFDLQQSLLRAACIFCRNHEKINCLACHARITGYIYCVEAEIVCAYESECVAMNVPKPPLVSVRM